MSHPECYKRFTTSRSLVLTLNGQWHVAHLTVGHGDQLGFGAMLRAAHYGWRRNLDSQLAAACKPRQ